MNNFLAALDSLPHNQTPVWFMRQAGRYLPGYSSLRKEHSIKEICRNSELTARVTEEPVNLLGVDAAIVFSDITIPLEAMGFSVNFKQSVGPVISKPFTENRSLDRITDFTPSDYSFGTYDAIRKFKKDHPKTPLIGFSGGPLTVGSYISTGQTDRNLAATKSLIYNDDRNFSTLMGMLREMVISHCREQIRSGADAIQIFDSWAGYLSPREFRKYARKYLNDIRSELPSKTKIIYFSTQTGGMLEDLEDTGFDFLSLDWRVILSDASLDLKPETGLQGNLDPLMVAESPARAVRAASRISNSMRSKDNYIFNLGHGVLPNTNPETLREIVRTVHRLENET